MAAFRKGERVRLASGRSCAQHGPGTEGVISYVPTNAHWVGVRFDGGSREFTPNPDRLVRVIDWTLPIELSDGTPLIVSPAAPGDSEHTVEIRRVTPGPHPAFPSHPCNGGTARRDGGLVCSNHKFYVRNREPKIMPHPIDTSKALEIFSASSATEPRAATFVTETSDGNILVDASGFSSGWFIFDKHGEFVRSANNTGVALKLRNKPVKSTEYIVLTRSGSPVVGLNGYKNAQLAWDQNPEADFLVRVHKTDGVVTNVDALKR